MSVLDRYEARIIYRRFLQFKFLGFFFFGLASGSIYTVYAPLSPSVFSIGGVLLSLGMIAVAKKYGTLLRAERFFAVTLISELLVLSLVLFFLLAPFGYETSLFIYAGYTAASVFGVYQMRAESNFLKKTALLTMLDGMKQKGYIAGLAIAYIYYKALEWHFGIAEPAKQVFWLHFVLLLNQAVILLWLLRSFRFSKKYC